MRIFDCTTFFEEHLMMELRFNILNKYVEKFIVVESRFSHSGKEKEIKKQSTSTSNNTLNRSFVCSYKFNPSDIYKNLYVNIYYLEKYKNQ